MDNVGQIVAKRNNVYVGNNTNNNVYDEEMARRIQEAVDKPKAIAKELSEKLNAPQNKRLYIKLAYEYPAETLFRCLAITLDTARSKPIRSKAAYFYGVVRRQK